MQECKSRRPKDTAKNGKARGKQRHKRKGRGFNFVAGDRRTNERTAAKKAMCVILCSLGKASYNMLAHVFDTWPSLVYRWIREAGEKCPARMCRAGSRRWSLTRCGISWGQKKQALGHQGPWPWHTENCGLGARRS